MKRFILIVFFAAGIAQAQTVDLKDVTKDESETTTIEIKKGAAAAKAEALWEVHDGTSDLEGDPGTTVNNAKQNWKLVCNQWKKDFRADNKENKIINLDCGSARCEGEPSNRICTSKASYKIKTRVN